MNKMIFFLVLLLQLMAAVGQFISFTVRDGGDVTLPCNNTGHDQDNCTGTTWSHQPGTSQPVEVILHGQIKVNPDRLSLTEKCSLFIKNLTADDGGLYICQQSESGSDQLYLSVVSMTEHKLSDSVLLTCSVTLCRHTVKWLDEGNTGEEEEEELRTPESECSDTVTVQNFSEESESLKCEVTDTVSGKVDQFSFTKTSRDKRGEGANEPTTKSTTVEPTTTSQSAPVKPSAGWWGLIVVPVVVAVAVVINIRWKKTKETKPKPHVDPNTNNPEEGVSYATISFTNSKAKGDTDGGEAVTYSEVKAPSASSAGASADPITLCAAIN